MFVNYFVQILSKLDPDLRNVVQNDEKVHDVIDEVLRPRYSKNGKLVTLSPILMPHGFSFSMPHGFSFSTSYSL